MPMIQASDFLLWSIRGPVTASEKGGSNKSVLHDRSMRECFGPEDVVVLQVIYLLVLEIIT